MKQNMFVMLLAVLSVTGMVQAAEIDSDLAWKIQQADPNEVMSTLVYLNDQVDPFAFTQLENRLAQDVHFLPHDLAGVLQLLRAFRHTLLELDV